MKETINKAAHTPGPWTADKLTNRGHNGAYYWHIQDKEGDEGQLIALVPSLYAGTTFPETEEANTRLIAAAPELLRLVEHLEQLIQPVIEYPHACDANSLLAYRLCQLEGGLKQARAAIAKARK